MKSRWTLIWPVLLVSACAWAQPALPPQNPSDAPLDPNPHPTASNRPWPQAPMPQADPSSNPGPLPQSSASPGIANPLTVKDAEQIAIKNNPQISVARLTALASQQVTREVRSSLWPTAVVNFTGVDAHDNSRITAGGLNNPIIYERVAGGTTVTQLITDFGHTTNLVASAHYREQAEAQSALATRQQILLTVDQAFYSALQTRAVQTVAEQTVKSRQVVADQVSALAKSKLKSDLDLSFANVNLAQAQLLLLDAQNNYQAALANLSALLGYATLQNFQLVEDTEPLTPPPADLNTLVADAFRKRPEIQALDLEYQAGEKYRRAQRDELFPTISALGAIGDTPAGNQHLGPWYGAVGVNIEIPVFNGFLFNAREHEASLREEATRQQSLDLRNRIARDVRTSWLDAGTAYRRLSVSQQLLQQANLALDLAQTRYSLGLGSIVELSQAQLQQTQAEIGNTEAGYLYRLSLSVLRYQTSGW